ncbi:hypothetical protein PVAR5_4844 [Paecilomyces variotii No. 5]|uniref:Uncharacterized protein n=1 Tax=Byssochlamys spectabilis (strain No. 5 / NBRC 109023) TaxID=1356009 RepID=V5FF73_BYSSN|nr:hypothetical protein PVAR5_4844 [Paecilomyces variotii No. 5]
MVPNGVSLRSARNSRLESNTSMRPEHQSIQSSVTHFPGPPSTAVPNSEDEIHPAFRTKRGFYAGFQSSGDKEEHVLETTTGSSNEFRKSDLSESSPSLLYRIVWSRCCKITTGLAVVALLVAIVTLSICIATGAFQHRNGTTETEPDGHAAMTSTATSLVAEDTSVLAAWPTITASASKIIHVHMDAARAQSEPTTLMSVMLAPGTSSAATAGVVVTSTDQASDMRC